MIFSLLRHLFAPPSRWRGCSQPTEYDRLAAYERRLGEYKAQQWIRNQRVAQVFDARASVQPKITPRLPQLNVLEFRRKA